MAQFESPVTSNPISLIFPRCTRKEELVPVLKDVRQFFSKWPSPPEVFVPFLPQEYMALRKDFILINDSELGFGAAVREALMRSRSEYCFVLDLPLEFPLADVFNAWMEFESSNDIDIVIGSRRHAGSQHLAEPRPWHWKLDSWVNQKLHAKLKLPLQDITTSFFGFRARTVKPLITDVRERSRSYVVPLLKRAQEKDLKIVERPTHWHPDHRQWSRICGDEWKLFRSAWF